MHKMYLLVFTAFFVSPKIPYITSGKCWREKTLANLAIYSVLWIRQSFIHQLLVVSEKAIEAGLKLAKVFFAKIFRYMVYKEFLNEIQDFPFAQELNL